MSYTPTRGFGILGRCGLVKILAPGAAEAPTLSPISRGLTKPHSRLRSSAVSAAISKASLAPPFTQLPNCGRLTSAQTKPQFDTITPAIVADPAGVGRGSGAGGGGSSGLGSPVSERHTSSAISNRKRNASLAGFDSSPGTVESPEAEGSEDGNHDDKRKQPVKRACNECRQQKVSHRTIGQQDETLCLSPRGTDFLPID
jgi:hypothetical protein